MKIKGFIIVHIASTCESDEQYTERLLNVSYIDEVRRVSDGRTAISMDGMDNIRTKESFEEVLEKIKEATES